MVTNPLASTVACISPERSAVAGWAASRNSTSAIDLMIAPIRIVDGPFRVK